MALSINLSTSFLCYLSDLSIYFGRSHRAAWDTGIWAWDCVHEDHVLVIPFVAALLGDNPMQSEFACHVGPGGKSVTILTGKTLDSAVMTTRAEMYH
jgi:hypothetical protein